MRQERRQLISWAGGVTHEIDVGGIAPGSMCYGHADRYGDGLLISAELVGTDDVFHEDYLQRCRDNVRAEMYWVLDEKTRLTGCQLVREQVYRTIEEVGIDTYKAFVREAVEEGRRTLIGRVRQLTFPGEYEAPTFIDIPWAEDETVHALARKDSMMHAPLRMKVSGDGHLSLSFDGANQWDYHSFNCSPSAMQGAMWVQLTQTLWNSDKINDGAYFASTLELPYGSWCNPDFDKVSTTLTWFFLIPAFTGFIRSLARAYFARGYLEEISASYPCTWNLTQGGGINHFGQPSAFTNFEQSCQGTGAQYVKDGEASCAAMWNPEGDMGEIETWEHLEPLLYLGRGLKANSSGPGRYRGGCGSEALRMVFKTPGLVLFSCGEGQVFSSAGVFGGYPGNSGYRHNVHDSNIPELAAAKKPYPVLDGDPENSSISALASGREVFDENQMTGPHAFGEYDLYTAVQRGGPGLGDPLERDADSVAKDVNGGELLERYARPIYGVVLVSDGNGKVKADKAATAAERQAMRKKRLERAVDAGDYVAAQRERVLAKDFIAPVRNMYASSMKLSDRWAGHFRTFWSLPDDFAF